MTQTTTLLSTILVLLVGSTLIMGAVYVLLGFFRLGGLLRFLPYPILGGFLAGTGWPPTMLLGVLMLPAANRWQNPLVLAAGAVLAVLAFYAVASALGLGFATLTADGWLLGIRGVIRGALRNATVEARREIEMLIIPREVYLRHWHRTDTATEMQQRLQQADPALLVPGGAESAL